MDSSTEHLQLQTLMKQTDIGIAATDASGRMTLLSPGLRTIFGPKAQMSSEADFVETFGLYADDGVTRLSPEDVPLTRARRGELVRDAVISARLGDGTQVYLRCNGAPLRAQDGSIDGAVVLVDDITAERRADAERTKLRDRLVDTINHEFRTPLAKLMGHTELLVDLGEDLPPDAQRSLAGIASASRTLDDLVHTISSLVDLHADSHLATTNCNVGQVVESVADDFAPIARAAGLSLVLDIRQRSTARIDEARLGKAVSALVENALCYAPTGSEVSVHVCGDDAWVQVTITDAGPGIARVDRDRLVQPFERGEHPQQPVSSRGLGLAVARTIATAHGGRLLLADNKPNGLLATVYVPRYGSVALLQSDPPPHEAGKPCPAGPADAMKGSV